MRFRSVVEFVSIWSPGEACKVGQFRESISFSVWRSPVFLSVRRRVNLLRMFLSPASVLVAREKFCLLVSCDGFSSRRVVRVGLAEVIRRVVGAMIAYRFLGSVSGGSVW
ncbi:unnamed protein product [Brassica oleracea var. botrytis]